MGYKFVDKGIEPRSKIILNSIIRVYGYERYNMTWIPPEFKAKVLERYTIYTFVIQNLDNGHNSTICCQSDGIWTFLGMPCNIDIIEKGIKKYSPRKHTHLYIT